VFVCLCCVCVVFVLCVCVFVLFWVFLVVLGVLVRVCCLGDFVPCVSKDSI
jgi:hypothetical protein